MDLPAPANTAVSSDGRGVKGFLLASLDKLVDFGVDAGRTYVREVINDKRVEAEREQLQTGVSDGPQYQPSRDPTSQAAVQSVPATQTLGAVFAGGATLSSIALIALVVLGVMELTD